MPLIDTHCHLTHPRLAEQLPAVLERARRAGVTAMICAAADLEESAAARDVAHRHDDIYFTAGVHPHDAATAPADLPQRLAHLAADDRCVAVGEIGLDYHYDYSPRDVQRKVFAEQLALARTWNKPIVIHSREVFADTLAILRDSGFDGQAVVFHSFTEGPDAAQAALDLGAAVSFSGIVTFANADILRQAAILVPDDRLLIETDAPFLSPQPVRKMKTNEPANVIHVAACLADLRGVRPDALADLTAANAQRIFRLATHA